MSAPKHKSVRETIGFSCGLGFLTGMFLPVGLMEWGLDFQLERLPLFVALLIFVGSPFVVSAFAALLAWLGVLYLGRAAIEYCNTGFLLFVLAVLGWLAGNFISGENRLAGVICMFVLVLPNVLLFYSRREYLFGEPDSSQEKTVVD